MTRPDDVDTPVGYQHDEHACLARTAESLDFGSTTADEAADAAQRRVDPFSRILTGLLRGLRRRGRR